MPTRYFAASVDQNWETLGNWWANAACDEGFSGTLTGVTVTDTDATVTCDSTAGLVVDRPITGTGIDTGSTVASITNGTTFELSLPAIANGSSNLTCEKHVIPVTGDNVVIATGNNAVSGTPSADVLGLVTVNGNSSLSVPLAAANFEFNGSSFNEDTITGDCTFNGGSRNSFGYITGNCTFNDTSYNASGGGTSITGDVTFNDDSYNEGIITGNATFTNTVQSTAVTGRFNPQQGTVSGTVDFPNGATFTLADSESWTADASAWTGTLAWEFNGSSYNSFGYITGNCTFNDTSYNSNGTIAGNCTFNDSSYNNSNIAGTVTFNDSSYNNSYITGDCTFNGSSYNYSYGTITGNCTFYGNSQNSGTITGDCVFNDTSWNGGPITGNVTFNDYSTFYIGSYGPITGNATFNDSSYNYSGNVTGDCVFNDTSYNDGYAGNCVFNDTSYNNYGQIGNTIFNDYSYNRGYSSGSTGDITFNDHSYNRSDSYGSLVATTVTFNDHSYNRSDINNPIVATVTFNDHSYNGLANVAEGYITGDCVFNDSSFNEYNGTITGNCEFNDDCSNIGTITGNGIIRQHAAAFVAWRDYATSTYVTGTLTLQFPEMDILGTGLL
jgi:hypothetical protein